MTLPELPSNWQWPLTAKLLGIWRGLDGGTPLTDANNDFPNVPDLNAVSPMRLAYNAPQNRFDLSIEPTALIPSVQVNDTAFVDAAYGNDGTGEVGEQTLPFKTIGAALTAVALVGPSAANPMLVLVRPGTYSELPLNMIPYVTVTATATGTSLIVASDDDAALIVGANAAILRGFVLSGATAAGGYGASMTTAGRMIIEDCVISDCQRHLLVAGAGSSLIFQRSSLVRNPGDVDGEVLAESSSSGYLGLNQVFLLGPLGGPAPAYGVIAKGGATAELSQVIIQRCDVAVEVDGAAAELSIASLDDNSTQLKIGSGGGTLRASNVRQSGTGQWALLTQAPSTVVLSGTRFDGAFSLATGTKLAGDFFRETDARLTVVGELCVGIASSPASAAFGQGCSTTDGLRAFHGDNVEADDMTDVTAAVLSPSGSPIDLVPDVTLGSSFFLGSDVPLPGAYFDVITAQVGGTITPKYWNGSAWTAIPRWMTAEALAPYGASANAMFAATGKQDQRWDGSLPGDTAKALAATGVVKYWYLWEVTSALTTAPRIEHAKLHTHHSRFGSDGRLLHYGDARPIVRLDLDVFAVGGDGNLGTTQYSANVRRQRLGADFQKVGLKYMGYLIPLPDGYDTSYQALLIVEWKPSTTNTGAAGLTTYHVVVPPRSILNGTLPGEVSLLRSNPAPGVVDQIVEYDYPIAIPTAVSGVDSLALTVERTAADAFTGTVEIEKVTLVYREWRE